ncbi:unnamed protein product [Clonostachys rosea]|uniref:Glycoside hydrolase 131 catalytic N-terminal domain-containing protein n=1 Tax=Bionectria ochroleuca TaxID=29856 RepID=A0ABY6U1P0_BIOOC|nr:unnamed protein product [Clonostachys rosea]
MKPQGLSALAALVGFSNAALLWDGRFNDLSTATDLDKWSWANQVGPYQWYIHGTGATTEYVELSSSNKNPADTVSTKGAKISLTSTSFWNGQNMRRTEIIPQTKAEIGKGKKWYHFSISRAATNVPSAAREHQIAFFESHFTELKSGGSGFESTNHLRWYANGQSLWETAWEAGVWHNIAYEIDFDGGSVGLWHSEGSSPLTQVVAPVSVSASSNGQDWHVGVLELPNGDADANEDLFFSGVYIEDGSITTAIGGPAA